MPAVLLLSALAAALRFPTLDVQSFYIDEAHTVVIAVQPNLPDALSIVGTTESTPPLYYILVWAWEKLFGAGEVGLRSLSALLGTATVPIAYAAGNALAGRRTGLITAALVAVSPFLAWYSQEARSYVLLVLLATLSALLFSRALDSPSRPRLALWALCCVLMLATHYFAAFLVAAEGAWLFRAMPGRRRSVAVALGGVAAAWGALLPLAIHQGGAARTAWIAAIPLNVRLEKTVKEFVTGPTGAPGVWLGALAFMLVLVGAWLLLRRADPQIRRRGLVAVGVGGLALAAPLLAALIGIDYFFSRNVMGAWPLVVVALAAGFAAHTRGVVAAGALCAVLALVTLSVPSRSEVQRTDWRGITEAVGDADSRRALLVTPVWEYVTFKVYRRRAEIVTSRAFPVREVALVASRGQLASVPPLSPPPGFRPAGTETVQAMAVVRFRAPRPKMMTPRLLRAWAARARLIYPAIMVEPDRSTMRAATR